MAKPKVAFLHKENALTVRLSFFERGLSGKCALLVWIGSCSTTGIQVIIGSIARLQLVGAAVMIRSTTSEGVEAGDERRVVFEAAKNVIFMHQLYPINPFLQESFMIQGVPIFQSSVRLISKRKWTGSCKKCVWCTLEESLWATSG